MSQSNFEKSIDLLGVSYDKRTNTVTGHMRFSNINGMLSGELILPSDLTIRGSLSFHNSDVSIISLPRNLTVYGCLDLRMSPIKHMSDGLIVLKTLNISETSITVLPRKLLADNLDISDTDIAFLPDDIDVRSRLSAANCKYLKILPDSIKVLSSLILYGSGVTNLNHDLKITEYLDISYTCIESIPDDLTLWWALSLRGSNIKVLPKNLWVGRFLYMEDTAIEVLPFDMWCPTYNMYVGNSSRLIKLRTHWKKVMKSKLNGFGFGCQSTLDAYSSSISYLTESEIDHIRNQSK